MGMRFEDLKVWQKSVELVKDIYKVTSQFPQSEIYSLTSQIRRSCISIPSNIAEGKGRNGIKEFINFLHIALGSLYELKTQLFIAKELFYLKSFDFQLLEKKIVEIDRMINALITSRKIKVNGVKDM